MFRKMRRIRQQLPEEEVTAIMERNAEGVLSLLGDDGYPYGVPVNYVWYEGKIYFHAAIAGHKKDAMENHEKVCFTVIDTHEVLSRDRATRYRSVIAFGHARFITDPDEKRKALQIFGYKHAGDFPEDVEQEIETTMDRTLTVEITVDHITGKESKDLMLRRNQPKGTIESSDKEDYIIQGDQ